MLLSPGARLGVYEIVSPLRAGGMGEVSRARDPRLHRDVAVKVLPDTLAADPQFRDRFDREARAIAALNHPHICTLHDVGDQHGTAYLVMELVEGETLATRLQRGAIPVVDALKTAVEIASALDAAHRAGVVHRDLKPGNIMLTKSGAKLLDFGLAKTGSSSMPVAGLSMLPTTPPVTAAAPLTGQGTILGTFQYMAPEQIEGIDADPRTDIFAFGALVYEMITGRKAFEGRSQASLIAAILERQPEAMSAVQPIVPTALDHVVTLCLAKSRDNRWQSIHDVEVQLRWIAAGGGTVSAPIAMAKPRRALERLAWVSTILVAVLATAAVVTMRHPDVPPQVARLSVALPPSAPLALFDQAVAMSPDGTRIVYRAGSGTSPLLYVRKLDEETAVPLRGTDFPESPFFSPDGQWIGFFSGAQLKKVPVSGGVPLVICDVVSTGLGGTWGPDDTIVFANADVDFTGLLRVPASGGRPQRWATPEPGGRYTFPSFLPDGKAIVFAASSGLAGETENASIVVRRVDSGEQRVVFAGANQPRYVPSGHLIVSRIGTLLAVPFDASRLEVIGPAAAVVEGVMVGGADGGAAQYEVSRNGHLVYATGSSVAADREVVWVNRRGEESPIGLKRQVSDLSLSPDGRTLAFSLTGENQNIWTFDLASRTLSRLSFGKGVDQFPRWTPDGRRIAYSSSQAGPYQVYWKAADGSGAEELLVKAEVPGQFPRSWSVDGRWLLFQRGTAAASNDLWVMPADGREKPRAFLATPANETSAEFSPDGRWVAYQSTETGISNIFVQAFPGPGGKWQVSTDGGLWPMWRRDGRELFYRTGDAMMVVPVTTDTTFGVGAPQELFRAPYQTSFDVSPDGQRFLVIKSGSASTAAQLNVVLNWTEALKSGRGRN